MPIIVKCPICDDVFEVRPSRFHKSNGPYCSHTCASNARIRSKKNNMPMPRATIIGRKAKKKKKLVNARKCIEAIKKAILKHGGLTYHVKGSDSVMDLSYFSDRFKKMEPNEVIEVLEEVHLYEHGYVFVGDIVASINSVFADKILESSILSNY